MDDARAVVGARRWMMSWRWLDIAAMENISEALMTFGGPLVIRRGSRGYGFAERFGIL